MNADILKGKWKEIKGVLKQKWGKLTDDDITQIEGMEDRLLGALQKRYGYTKEIVEKEYEAFMSPYQEPSSAKRRTIDRKGEKS
jgi:uncharacterized protein YjbJ (UPF0337 family)